MKNLNQAVGESHGKIWLGLRSTCQLYIGTDVCIDKEVDWERYQEPKYKITLNNL